MSAPRIIGASPTLDKKILITFDQAMENNAVLSSIGSYGISPLPVNYDGATSRLLPATP